MSFGCDKLFPGRITVASCSFEHFDRFGVRVVKPGSVKRVLSNVIYNVFPCKGRGLVRAVIAGNTEQGYLKLPVDILL